MPTASEAVRKPWHDQKMLRRVPKGMFRWTFFGWAFVPAGDIAAFDYLMKRGFTENRGQIFPPKGIRKGRMAIWDKPFTKCTEKEWSAIIYLCDEWDYSYAGDKYWDFWLSSD